MKRTSYTEITSYTNTTPSLSHYSLDYRSYDIEVEYPKTEIIFHPKEGLPIKLNPNNFTTVSTACRHGIVHSFNIPVQSRIEWKIEGGLNNGAFKTSYATNAKYAAWDIGDSVIYYPSCQELESEERKEIQISVTVKSYNITIKNRNSKVDEINYDTTKKSTIILVIQRTGGIRRSYSVIVRVKKMELREDLEKNRK